MEFTKIEVKEFLKQWCDEVYEMPCHELELIMDDHICIRWEGIEYFVPENNSFWDDKDYDLYDWLENNYIL